MAGTVRRLMLVLTCAGVLLATAVTSLGGGGLTTLEEVLARYIDAVGGSEAVARHSTRIGSGRVIDDRPYRGPVSIERFHFFAEVPDRYVIVTGADDEARREGYDGERGWRTEADSVVDDDRSRRSKLGWLLNPRSPLRLEQTFGLLRYRGSERWNDRVVHVVETDRSSTYYSLRFDAATGLLVGIGYYWTLDDYREVDGVWVPFRVSMSRKGGAVTYEFERFEYDVRIEEAVFAAPR